MSVEVRVSAKINDQAVSSFLGTQGLASVQRALDRTRDAAKAEITTAGRVRSGAMREGVQSERATLNGNQITGRVIATAPHSGYQHEGTANDGQGFIYPRRARVLRFRGSSGAIVFAPRVRGVKGHPFLTLAMERLRSGDFT